MTGPMSTDGSDADVAEQQRSAAPTDDDGTSAGGALPYEANEADVAEQLADVPFDEDDR